MNIHKTINKIESAVVRFAGDSGDGMQLSGTFFANVVASLGIKINTFPDYPSEVRAPEGTLYGVSAFQVNLGTSNIHTPGDEIDVLVAMNASSLKVNLPRVKKGGILIVNKAGFNDKHLKLALLDENPLSSEVLNDYQLFSFDISQLVKEILIGSGLSSKHIERTKNIFALGITYWLFGIPLQKAFGWIEKKFANNNDLLASNLRVLEAGWNFAEDQENFGPQYTIASASQKPGYYRNITGNHAVALGLVAAAKKANLPLFLGSYPITPASEILQYISGYKQYGVKHLQAEDEIGGITSAIGAAFGGSLAATTTSGPGLSLKIEAIGLAIITELPLVIVNVQRAGPSTGLPTKTEQSDLLLAVHGRHGEAPLPVIAAASSTDCFHMTIEAARIALKYMTPVILLTDGYLAQGAEPWRVPSLDELPKLNVDFATDPNDFNPYRRNPETLARNWAIPGMKGMEHRIGGLEKQDVTGNVSHDPENHQKMVELRQKKIDNITNDIPLAKVEGHQSGNLLVIGWGSTYGAIKTAFDDLQKDGFSVSYLHLRYLNPLPANLGEILHQFDKILVPEMNMGQLKMLLQAKYLLPILGFNKIQGQPFKAEEIKAKVKEILNTEV
jgi:2-oxoglutarate/2-oxoacid ferredoxin oxidoreductase subunit alpha